MYWHVSAINPVSARLIGAIFLERGLVTEEQLESALALQVETKEHLGEILVQHFGVSRIELASVLAEQWAELERANAGATPPEVEKPTLQVVPDENAAAQVASDDADAVEDGEPRRPLGEIFVERGLVTDAQLDIALQIQKEGGEKLGEILVAQGSITRLQLASALAEQWTALRKIRPPSPHEDPAVPAPTTVTVREVVPSPEVDRLHEAVSALEQRLRAAESVAAREPWREEIATATEGLQGMVAKLEERLEEAATRDELVPVEELRTRVQELANRLEENAASERIQDADLTRRVESAAAAAEAAKSSLGGAFESLSLRLADVESRVHDRTELVALQQEVSTLVERLGQLGGEDRDAENAGLRDEVKRLADEVNRLAAVSGELDPELAARVDALSSRLDDVVPALRAVEAAASNDDRNVIERELTALASRLEGLEKAGSEIAEIRGSLAELHARPAVDSVLADRLSHYGAAPDQLAELRGRLEQVERQSAELADGNPALDERIESLGGRLEALETAGATDELLELQRAVEELAARPAADPALAERVERIADRLEALPSAERVAELRERIDELALRPVSDPGLSERIERVANRLDVTASADQLDELRARLDEVAARGPEPAEGVAELRAKVETLASRPVVDPGVVSRLDTLANRLDVTASADQLDELRARLDEVAARGAEPAEGVAELRAKVENLASRPVVDPGVVSRLDTLANRLDDAVSAGELAELRVRLEELASRPSGPPEGLADLRTQVEELTSRPAFDPELADRVERIANRIDAAPSTERLDELSERIDALAAHAATPAEGLDELRARIEELGSRSATDGALAEQVEMLARTVAEVSARASASPEAVEKLSRRLDEIAESTRKLPKLRERVEDHVLPCGSPVRGARRASRARRGARSKAGRRSGPRRPSSFGRPAWCTS